MGLAEYFQQFGYKIVNFLPKSPFISYLNQWADSKYLKWLNWFIPWNTILSIFGAWLGCVATFYLVQIVLRWLKVIQG